MKQLLEDKPVPIVGKKEIFAIEWEFYSALDRWIYAHFQYWGGDIPIGDWEDLIDFPDVVINHHLSSKIDGLNFPVDCSNFSKDYLFSALFDYINEEKYREEYSEFYHLVSEAKKFDKSDEYPNIMGSIIVFPGDESPAYRIEYPPDDSNIDQNMASWMSHVFDVSDMGCCAIDGHAMLYFVHDVSKNQERLIWKNIYHYRDDKGCNFDTAFSTRPFESVMPVGYFRETIREFVRVASDEIAELRHQARYFRYDLFLENLAKSTEKDVNDCPPIISTRDKLSE